MDSPRSVKKALKERAQLQAQQARGEYARRKDELKDLQAELQEHTERQEARSRAIEEAEEERRAAEEKARRAQEALREAEAAPPVVGAAPAAESDDDFPEGFDPERDFDEDETTDLRAELQERTEQLPPPPPLRLQLRLGRLRLRLRVRLPRLRLPRLRLRLPRLRLPRLRLLLPQLRPSLRCARRQPRSGGSAAKLGQAPSGAAVLPFASVAMDYPLSATRALKERVQPQAQQARGRHARHNETEDLQAELQEHTEQQEVLSRAFEEAEEERRAAEEKARRAQEALREAEAARAKIVQAVHVKEDELVRARAAEEEAAGEARAAGQALAAAFPGASAPAPSSSESSAGSASSEPASKRSLVAFPSWGTGRIYSEAAKQSEPDTRGWVQGYPHQADPRCKQRFVVHFDSSKSTTTTISKFAFDFLGLERAATTCRSAPFVGVMRKVKPCPVYEIRFSVDVLSRASGNPDRIFARTVTAAVVETDLRPGQVGYYDLLVSAEDTRKFTDFEVSGKKFRLDDLQSPPKTLYDGLALRTRASFSFSAEPQASPEEAARELLRPLLGAREGPLGVSSFDPPLLGGGGAGGSRATPQRQAN